jgi:hypothetical protein
MAIAAVIGAFLETLAASLAGLGATWWWPRALIALIGAVVLAVVPYVTRTKTSREQVRDWVRARSASEALKEEIYRYLVGAPPYGPDPSPTVLIERSQGVKDTVKDLAGHAARIGTPPQKERPVELTIDGYVEKRVDDQIDRFYRPKGKAYARIAQRIHDLEFLLGLLAVIMAAAASAAAATGLSQLAGLGSWVAVVTTAGAAVTAHLAAARFDHQAMTYFATAERLTSLRDAWRVDDERNTPSRVGKFVDDCENAISVENEAWLAEWTREEREAKQA